MDLADETTNNNNNDNNNTIDSDRRCRPAESAKETTTATTTGDDNNNKTTTTRRRMVLSWSVLGRRTVFVVVTALSIGLFTGFLLRTEEKNNRTQTFVCEAEAAVLVARNVAIDGLDHATTAMARIVATAFPNASDWPNVWIDGFPQLATDLLPSSLSGSRSSSSSYLRGDTAHDHHHHKNHHNNKDANPDIGLFLAPLVTPEQVSGFEAFVVDKYNNDKYNITDNDGDVGDGEGFLVPVLQNSPGMDAHRLLNLYRSPRTMRAIDNVLECIGSTQQQQQQQQNTTAGWKDDNCSALGSMVLHPPVAADADTDSGVGVVVGLMEEGPPSVMMVVPVYPANDPHGGPVVGFVLGVVGWKTILHEIGIDVGFGFDAVVRVAEEGVHDDDQTQNEEVVVVATYAGSSVVVAEGEGEGEEDYSYVLESMEWTTPEAHHSWVHPPCGEGDVVGGGGGGGDEHHCRDRRGDNNNDDVASWSWSSSLSLITNLYPSRFANRPAAAGSTTTEHSLQLSPGRDYVSSKQHQHETKRVLLASLFASGIVVVASVLFFVVNDRCCGGDQTKKQASKQASE